MLFRCDIDPIHGLVDLYKASLLAACFKARGQQVAYAIRKDGVEEARRFLGEDAQIFRMPDDPGEDADRLAHLSRTHKHRVLFVMLREVSSAYLFQVHRLFPFTAVVDRGATHMIYANLVVNGRLNAQTHSYTCCPEARLLLGPRYHLCDPSPLPPKAWPARVDRLLLSLGQDEELIDEVLAGLANLPHSPEVHLLLADDALLPSVVFWSARFPQLHITPIVPTTGEAFAYHEYPLLLVEMGELCLDLARQGLCFATVATHKDQLQDAYLLEQLGVAPTLGWRLSKRAEAIADVLGALLADAPRREAQRRQGPQLVDGQAVLRIVRFVPGEAGQQLSTP